MASHYMIMSKISVLFLAYGVCPNKRKGPKEGDMQKSGSKIIKPMPTCP